MDEGQPGAGGGATAPAGGPLQGGDTGGDVPTAPSDSVAAKLLAHFQSAMVLDRWWLEWWRTRGDGTVAGEGGESGDGPEGRPLGPGVPRVPATSDPLTVAKLALHTKT